MGCTTAVNTKTCQAERARGRTKGQEGREGEIPLHWVFRHKVENWHRRLLQLDVNADRFGSAVTGSLCKCHVCGGKSSRSLPQPCHFAPVLFTLRLSNTDAVSDSCCLSLCRPHGQSQLCCAAAPHPGGLCWLQTLREAGFKRGWAQAPSFSGSSIPS